MSDAELAFDALRLESMRTHVAVVKCEPANGLLEIGVHVELAHGTAASCRTSAWAFSPTTPMSRVCFRPTRRSDSSV